MYSVKIGWNPYNRGLKFKLFCTCGLKKVINKEVENCPECNKKIDLSMNKKGYIGEIIQTTGTSKHYQTKFNVMEFTKITPDKDEFSIQEPSNYTLETHQYQLILNKENGELILKKGKKEMKIGESYVDDMLPAIQVIQRKDVLDCFLQNCLNKRGVDYRKISDFKYPGGMKTAEFCAHLAYPVLQNFPWDYYNYPFPKNIGKILQDTKTAHEIVDKYLISSTKSIRKMALSNAKTFNFLERWYPFIKKIENIRKLMEEYKCDYSSKAFDFKERNSFFNDGMELLNSFHPEETVFVNRLIKCKKDLEFKNIYQLEQYIEDIGNMFRSIKRQNNEFQVDFNGDLEDFHNQLTTAITNMKIKKVEYDFTEEQLKWEEKVGDTYFELAKNSHELSQIGLKMHHCVATYHEAVKRKKCSILVIKESEQPVVCMEIRGNQLVQAKMKFNYLPTEKYKEKIKNWAKKNEIKISNCSDIA
jgi:hypothetical protein